MRKLNLCSLAQELALSVDNRPGLKLGQKHIRHVRNNKSLGMILDKQLKCKAKKFLTV